MRLILLSAALLIAVASASTGVGTYSGILSYVVSCKDQFPTFSCGANYTSIREVHPVKSLACLSTNTTRLQGSCASDVGNHPFKSCACDANHLCGLSDPGDNGESDNHWVNSLYPIRKAVECLVGQLSTANNISSDCSNRLTASGYYTCQNDIKNLCTSSQITSVFQMLTCMNTKKAKVQSSKCLASLDQAVPENWEKLDLNQQLYYAQIFYGVPWGSKADVKLEDTPAPGKGMSPLGVFFIFAFLFFAIVGAIYSKKGH